MSEIRLTRDDVELILHGHRSTTIDEVEWLLAHAMDCQLQLTYTEELELRNIAARLIARRHIGNLRRQDRTEEWLATTTGTYKTEFGDLAKCEVELLESIRVQAFRAIHNCGTNHKRERCPCWREARERLFDLRSRSDERSPLSMGALAIWTSIENLAHTHQRRQEPPAEQGERVPGIVFNWRHFKAPEYVDEVLALHEINSIN